MTREDQPIQVMVVDDEQDIRDGSERILKRLGFQVFKASRGEEALEMLKDEPVSILLLDLKMPGMDGMEVLQHVRSRDPNVLIIVITGYATVETAIKAMKQGAYDFIPKPFDPDQLRMVIKRAAETIRLQRETRQLEAERRRNLADLDREKSRIRTILECLPAGLLVTNATGQVVLVNPACRNLLNLPPELVPTRPIEDFFKDPELCTLVRDISQGCYVDYDDIPDQEFAPSADTFCLARATPVVSEKMECLGAVVSFVDITAMKVLDRLKSEFVAKVSHELRSPLSTIHEQLALVLKHLVTGDTQPDQHILSRAQEKTRGLISLIGDLLDLSRIEEGLICREPKALDTVEILQGVVDFLRVRAVAKKQQLIFQTVSDNLPQITADPIALESIFGNLITNAINYTPEGGEITVSIAKTGLHLQMDVKDTGFGIDTPYLDKIFERFFRVKDDNTRYITGTGLGLPIVKGLVDAMGGIINVESTPGEGSTFSVLLPVVEQGET